jgi:hypothetical protein
MPIDPVRREKMLGHVARWKSGSLTQRDYCNRARIDYNQFHYWYRVSRGLTGKSHMQPSGFLPVRVASEAPAAQTTPEITITGASGLVARFPASDASLSLIRQLLNG